MNSASVFQTLVELKYHTLKSIYENGKKYFQHLRTKVVLLTKLPLLITYWWHCQSSKNI
jgi:hypothetical protein